MVTIELGQRPSRAELLELYSSVGASAYTDQPDVLVAAVAQSPFVAVARDDGEVVGLARAVSDDATIAYLQDLNVRPSHQRRGIGQRLVEAFLDRYAHVRQRVLLTDDEDFQRAFYEACGFTRADLVDRGPLRSFVRIGVEGEGSDEARSAVREGHIARVRQSVGNDLLLVPGVAVCLFDGRHRLLLAHHRGADVWSTPGGAVEPEETVAEACVREAREELGLDVEPVAVLGVFGPAEVIYPNGDRTSYVTTAFACTTSGSPQLDGTEVSQLRWVDAAGAADLPLAPWLRPRLPRVLGWRPGDATLFDPPGSGV